MLLQAVASESLETIAYELSAIGLKTQEAVLEEVRQRAAVLMTATSVAAGFLGTRAIDRTHHGVAIFGFVFAALAIGGCILVLLPKDDLFFTLSGPGSYEHFFREQMDADEAHRTLAYWLQDMRDGNEPKINDLIRAFRLACLLLLGALITWAAQFLVPW
jgi:hypothetical protein